MTSFRAMFALTFLLTAATTIHAYFPSEYAGPWTLSEEPINTASGERLLPSQNQATLWNGKAFPRRPKGTVFRLETRFLPPAQEPVSGFAFYIGPSDYPLDISVNGILLYRSGRYSSDPYMGLTHNSLSLQVPWKLIRPGESNRLEVIAYSYYDLTPIPEFIPTDNDHAAREAFTRNLLNSWLVLALTITALIICIYYIFLFFTHRANDFRHLWFAVTCFFFACSYCNFSVMSEYVNQLLFYKIARPGLFLSLYFTFLFTVNFTGFLRKHPRTRRTVCSLMGLFALIPTLIMLFQPDKLSLLVWYGRTMPFGVMFPLILILILLTISLIRRHSGSDLVMLVSFLAVVGSAVWDILFILKDRNPYFWLAPYGYAFFLIANMLVLAREQAGLYRHAIQSDRDIRKQNSRLEESMREKERVSGVIAENTQRVLAVSAQIASAADSLYQATLIQSEANERIVSLLSGYRQHLQLGLATLKAQGQSISEITSSVSGLSSGIDSIASSAEEIRSRMEQNVEQSRQGQKRLTESAEESARLTENIRLVTSTVQAVGESAENIDEILRIIQGIAEQTNILSMNAAIEAAHAGDSGKGFAVVAGEVRSLAVDSSRSTGDIERLIANIRSAIRDAVKTAEEMKAKADHARGLSDEASGLLSGIVSQIDHTNSDVAAIVSTTSSQKENGKTVSQHALAVRDQASSIVQSMEDQAREAEDIAQSVNQMADLIRESNRSSENLSRLAEDLKNTSNSLSSLIGN